MTEQKKEQLSKLILLVFALLIAAFSLVNTSVKTEIRHDVALDIYDNGTVVGQTVVHIDGTREEFLLGELLENQRDSFVGRFAIELAERTCSEHTSVQILWNEGALNHQQISFWSGGDFLVNEFAVNHVLLINPNMTEMAIQMKDGRVLASSEMVYDIYMAHFTYNGNNGTTGISGDIPEF